MFFTHAWSSHLANAYPNQINNRVGIRPNIFATMNIEIKVVISIIVHLYTICPP